MIDACNDFGNTNGSSMYVANKYKMNVCVIHTNVIPCIINQLLHHDIKYDIFVIAMRHSYIPYL